VEAENQVTKSTQYNPTYKRNTCIHFGPVDAHAHTRTHNFTSFQNVDVGLNRTRFSTDSPGTWIYAKSTHSRPLPFFVFVGVCVCVCVCVSECLFVCRLCCLCFFILYFMDLQNLRLYVPLPRPVSSVHRGRNHRALEAVRGLDTTL